MTIEIFRNVRHANANANVRYKQMPIEIVRNVRYMQIVRNVRYMQMLIIEIFRNGFLLLLDKIIFTYC